MKTISEGNKSSSVYSYSGNRVPFKANTASAFRSSTKRADPNLVPAGFGQPGYGNMSTFAAPMMSSAATGASPYQTLSPGQMVLAPQFAMQLPQMQTAVPQASIPNLQMLQAQSLAGVAGAQGMAGLSAAAMPTAMPATQMPAQMAAQMPVFAKAPVSYGQPQMPSWQQYGGAMPMGAYSMPRYPARSSASNYVVDYSDGLKILDEAGGVV